MPNVENILAPYAEKSYGKYITKYIDLGLDEEKAKEVAWNDVQREMEQGFQGWSTSLTLFPPAAVTTRLSP